MLHLLDDSLGAFLRAVAPLPTSDVDVAFEPPDTDWAAGLYRPTVNLYLWRLRRSANQSSAGTELVERDGDVFRRGPRPRVELGYMVTAWATDVRSTHQLLGRVLAAFLSTTEIPQEHLQGVFATTRPLPTVALSKAGDDAPGDFWSALGGRFQPGVELSVTATIDPEVLNETASQPTTVELATSLRCPPNRAAMPVLGRTRVRASRSMAEEGRVELRFGERHAEADDEHGPAVAPEEAEGYPSSRD